MSTLTVAVGPVAEAVRWIERVIEERALQGGDKLPTERDLAAQCGVSRQTIRTALDALEEQGRVLRQVGRGTYLAPTVGQSVVGRFDSCSPAEIMAARLALEPQLLPPAVHSATGEDIAEMRRHLAAGDAARDSPSFEQADTALHHSFALATHNTVMIMVSQILIDARQQPVWGTLKRRSFNDQTHHAYCTEHDAIVDAITERDTPAAQAAMHAHLIHVKQNLLGRPRPLDCFCNAGSASSETAVTASRLLAAEAFLTIATIAAINQRGRLRQAVAAIAYPVLAVQVGSDKSGPWPDAQGKRHRTFFSSSPAATNNCLQQHRHASTFSPNDLAVARVQTQASAELRQCL